MRIILVLALVLTACQQAPTDQTLPTVAVLASVTPSAATTAEATSEIIETDAQPIVATSSTNMTLPTLTPTVTPTRTSTSSPTETETLIPSATAIPATSTVGAPRIVTLTSVPAGQNAPANATPQVMADLTISEEQFQGELDTQMVNYPSIQTARIDFVEGGISVELTALGGDAFITGNVFLSMALSGDFITIVPEDIAVNAPEPPPVYVETVNDDFLRLILDTLDALLSQRLGTEHNLQRLVITPRQMEINLLVPQR